MEDDSFNEDDDSFFELYSTKNVTQTFQNQLKKLISSTNKGTAEASDIQKHDENVETTNSESPDPETSSLKDDLPDMESAESEDDDEERAPEQSPPPIQRRNKQTNGVVTDIVFLEEDDSTTLSHHGLSESSGSTFNCGKRRSSRLRKEPPEVIPLTVAPSNKKKTRTIASYFTNKPNSIVTVDEDCEELNLSVTSENNIELNTSMEDEVNYEMSVKVIWKTVTVKKFQIRRFQKLTTIFKHFMKEENVPENQIILTFNGRKVKPSDTPDTLNLKIYDFLDGGVVSEATNIKTNDKLNNSNPDSVNIKFQDAFKNIVNLSLGKKEKMKILMLKYSEQVEERLENIKFLFDGEILDPNETPESLGLEDEEIIDVKICK